MPTPVPVTQPPAPESDPVEVGICALIRQFMKLADDQVMIYNENWKVPADNRLYVTLSFLVSKPIGNSSEVTPVEGEAGLVETLVYSSMDTYTLNIMSTTKEAQIRFPELAMALCSTIAQQLQERLSFQLASLPMSMVDVSGIEGTMRLRRYAVTFNLIRSRKRDNTIPYFDKFTGTPALVINP